MDQGMKHVAGAKALALVTGLLAAALTPITPALAQVRGLPVYNAGVPRGIGVAADLGFPNDDAGGGLGYGVTGSAGLAGFGATATIAGYNPDGPVGADAALGATLNYRLFGGPLIPLAVTLQGGVGYYKTDALDSEVTDLHFPVGVGFSLTIPNPALAIKPWLAPRVDVVRRDVTTMVGPTSISDTDTQTEFGISGGVEFNFLNGFGIHAAYDLVTTDSKPGVFGFGVHYALKVPGQ